MSCVVPGRCYSIGPGITISNMKWLCALVALILTTLPMWAQSADEQFIRIYQVIQEADRLNEGGQPRAAATRYLEAQESLQRFQNVYRGWNDRVINYRLNYVASKIAALTPTVTTNAIPAAQAVNITNAGGANVAAMVTAPTAAVSAPVSSDLQQQLATLQSEVERLQAENMRISAKLKEALSVQPAALDPRELMKSEERARSLEKENDLLKVRLRSVTNAPVESVSPATAGPLKSEVSEQAEIIAALRSENEILKKQTAQLQKQIAAPRTPPAAEPTSPPGSEKDARIRELTDEVAGLQKERALLKESLQQKEQRNSNLHGSESLDALRARLEVLEAKPMPYTSEELALLNKSGMAVVHANAGTTSATQPPPAEGSGSPKRGTKEIPPGAGPLVAAAERAFAMRNFAEAEKKYSDVLRQDENNVSTLANLASAQLELGRVDEAERNVNRALALDPDDHFSLYVLGRIKFRQNKLDEALDALSRSAKANPEYAETQNYLGIVLSEKGLRIPAEAALRKAIQLQPNHPAAHNNLAVVYATQKPPALALARWHYQRALAAGHPRNPDLEKLLEQK